MKSNELQCDTYQQNHNKQSDKELLTAANGSANLAGHSTAKLKVILNGTTKIGAPL